MAETLRCGVLGHQDPGQHPWDGQTQRARDKGRPPPAAAGSSRRIRCAGSGHCGGIMEQRVQKGYTLPNTIFGLDPFYPHQGAAIVLNSYSTSN